MGAFRLEALRTRELILRHAPKPPAVVLDVGGAAGVYSFSGRFTISSTSTTGSPRSPKPSVFSSRVG